MYWKYPCYDTVNKVLIFFIGNAKFTITLIFDLIVIILIKNSFIVKI